MKPDYRAASEIQQFNVDSSAHTLFSQNPSAASSSVSGAAQEFHHFADAPPSGHKLISPYNPPPPVSLQFSHFHSFPISQQIFTRLPPSHHPQHHFQLENINSASNIMPPFLASKEPFWRPLDKEQGNPLFANRSHEAVLLETAAGSNYKPFSELEAIYRPGGSSATNQTTASGSALTGAHYSTGGEAHPINSKKPHEKPRRRLHRHREVEMEAFFEELVKQLMDKQEVFHNKLFDAMEQRDRERAGLEESRREQEAVQARRDAHDRSLIVAREAAIIPFLERITGETLNLSAYPQLISTDSAAGDITEGTISMMRRSSRWPKSEVQALIRVRSGLERRFQEPGLKGSSLWEEVSIAMAVIGYKRSSKRCKEKWENINKYFRKAKDSGRKRSEHSKTCPYFQQLDKLYPNSLIPTSQSPPPPDVDRKLDAVAVDGVEESDGCREFN